MSILQAANMAFIGDEQVCDEMGRMSARTLLFKRAGASYRLSSSTQVDRSGVIATWVPGPSPRVSITRANSLP